MKRVLVIQTASIGDVILATPVLEKLHHFYPEVKIDLLVKKGMEFLFVDHPFLNQVIIWNKTSGKYRNYTKILRQVRKNNYDAVINLQRFALTGILTSLSKSKIRIGFSKNPFSNFFTHRIFHEIKKGVHEVDRNLRLIEQITGDGRFKPRLYPSESNHTRTKHLKSSRYITISPASLWFTKQFPELKWFELMAKIDKEIMVYLLGSPADRILCERIVQGSGRKNITNLAGELTFLESATLMKDAIMNFTNDSAPMHLASAVNAPVCAIFCSTIPEFGFGPLSDDSTVVETKAELSCRPCGIHGYDSCPEKHFRCATTIEPDQLTFRFGN
jgi:heptosyltransferase II